MDTTLGHRAWADEQRANVRIKKVKAEGNGWYEITMPDGCCLGIHDLPEGCPAPQAGDVLTLWGENPIGLGRSHRGKAINGVVISYQTEAEQQAEWDQWKRERDAKRRAEYEANKPNIDRRIGALPEPYLSRMRYFQAKHEPDWWEAEEFELFACEQAHAFTQCFPAVAELDAFKAMTYQEQRVACPALSDQHSGCTFGWAVSMARAVLNGEAIVLDSKQEVP
jgi:hypothetical protein